VAAAAAAVRGRGVKNTHRRTTGETFTRMRTTARHIESYFEPIATHVLFPPFKM